MKNLAIALACFIIAFILGRWAPNYDLNIAQKQVADLKVKLENQKEGNNSQVTGMLGFRPAEKRDRDRPSPNQAPAPTNVVASATNEVAEVKEPQPPERRRSHRRDRPGEERMDEALELWELRTELAKTTFMDKLDASKEDALNFNVLMESLNLRAGASISNWVDRVEGQETISTEDGIRLFNSILDSVVLTYDEMDRKLPENWREGVGDDFQLMEMIDPRVAKPLLKLEDKMGEVRFF